MDDRDGALLYIERTHRNSEAPHDIDQTLARIEQFHAEDGDVLFRLGESAQQEDDWERAKSLLHRVVELIKGGKAVVPPFVGPESLF